MPTDTVYIVVFLANGAVTTARTYASDDRAREAAAEWENSLFSHSVRLYAGPVR